MTYGEALKKGYNPTRQSYERGYVSRKVNKLEQPVITNKWGWKYVLLPCWKSSQYCVRQYIEKENK